MSRARLALVGAVVGLIAACGGGDTGPNPPPPPPPPPTPAALAKQGGDNQTAEPGQAVTIAPSVKVTSTTGAAVSGVTVTFAVASGGGSVTGATPTTGSDGVATVGSWVLGSAGTNTLTATVTGTGITGNPATFSANAQFASFNPTANTTLTGTRTYASISIPAGVTVTVTGSLVLNVSGPVAIAGTLTGDCTSIEVRATGSLTVDGLVRNTCTVAPSGTAPGIKLVAGAGWTIGTTVSNQDAIVSGGSIRITDPATESLDLTPLPTLTDVNSPSLSDLQGPFSPQHVSPPSAANRPIKAGKGSDVGGSSDGPITVNGLNQAGDGKDAPSLSQAGACDNHLNVGGDGGKVYYVAKNSTLTFKAGSTVQSGNGGKGGSCTSTSGCPSSAIGGPGGTGGSVLFGGSSIVFEAGVNIIRGSGGEGGDATSKGDDKIGCADGCTATSTAGKGGNNGGMGFAVLSPGTITGEPLVSGADGGPGGRADATGGKGGNCATCPNKGGDGGTATSTGGDGGNGATSRFNSWAIAPGSHHKGFGGTANAVGGDGGTGASCCTPAPQQGGNGGKGGNATSTSGQPGTAGINAGGRGNDTGNGGNGGKGGDGNGIGLGGGKGTGTGSPNVIPDGTPGVDGNPCPGLSCTVTPASQSVVQGGTGSVTVNVVRTNLTGALTGTVKDNNGNVLTTFTIPAGSNSATVPFTLPSPLAPGGPFTFTVTVSGPGGTPTTNATFQVTISGGTPTPAEVLINLASSTPLLTPGVVAPGVIIFQLLNAANQSPVGTIRAIAKGPSGNTFYGNNPQSGGNRVGFTSLGSYEFDLLSPIVNGVQYLFSRFKACFLNGNGPVEVRQFDQVSQVSGLSNVVGPSGQSRVLLATTTVTSIPSCVDILLNAAAKAVELAKTGSGSVDANNIGGVDHAGPPPSGTTSRFCNLNSDRTLIWAAFSNNNGQNWTSVPIQNNPAGGQYYEYTAVGTQVAGATVADYGNNTYATFSYYGTESELPVWGNNSCAGASVGPNNPNITITGNQGNENAWVSVGIKAIVVPNGTFQVTGVPNGNTDVAASSISPNTGLARVFNRVRNVTPTGPITFNQAVGTTLGTATATFNSLNPAATIFFQGFDFSTQNQNPGVVWLGYGQFTNVSSATRTIQGVLAGDRLPGDYAGLYARSSEGSTRKLHYYGYNAAFGNMSVNFWSPITNLSRSCAGTNPVQIRYQATVPANYSYIQLESHQSLLPGGGARSSYWDANYSAYGGVNVDRTSSAFAGAGYNPIWGMQPGVAMTGSISAWGSNLSGGAFLRLPVDGLKVYGAEEIPTTLICGGP